MISNKNSLFLLLLFYTVPRHHLAFRTSFPSSKRVDTTSLFGLFNREEKKSTSTIIDVSFDKQSKAYVAANEELYNLKTERLEPLFLPVAEEKDLVQAPTIEIPLPTTTTTNQRTPDHDFIQENFQKKATAADVAQAKAQAKKGNEKKPPPKQTTTATTPKKPSPSTTSASQQMKQPSTKHTEKRPTTTPNYAVNNAVPKGIIEIPPILQENRNTTAGIGGDGGVTYDVNKVKRNLYQETMKSYRDTLMEGLFADCMTMEEDIVNRLRILVQDSPVRTTTDSNLLDGQWRRAFSSIHSTTRDLWEKVPPARNRTPTEAKGVQEGSSPRLQKRIGFAWNRGRLMIDMLDEDPHVWKSKSWFGGLLSRATRYSIRGLSRQNIQCQARQCHWNVCGKSIFSNKKLQTADWKVIYCDGEMAIIQYDDDSYEVYYKSSIYHQPRWRSVFKRRQWHKRIVSRTSKLFVDPIVREISVEGGATVRVLKLGDTKNEDEDYTWDSRVDPFVHLSADERQEQLKKMSVGEVQEAGRAGESRYRRRRIVDRINGIFNPRKTHFRKPE